MRRRRAFDALDGCRTLFYGHRTEVFLGCQTDRALGVGMGDREPQGETRLIFLLLSLEGLEQFFGKAAITCSERMVVAETARRMLWASWEALKFERPDTTLSLKTCHRRYHPNCAGVWTLNGKSAKSMRRRAA